MRQWRSWHLHLSSARPEMAEQVLRDVVAPVVTGKGDWFFIRYWQRGPHLRLRILDLDDDAAEDVLRVLRVGLATVDGGDGLENQRDYEALAARMAAAGEEGTPLEPAALRAPGAYVDRYEPELSRYGGMELMRLSEDLFATSSRLAMAFLRGEPEPKVKLGFAVNAIASALAVLDDPDRVSACCGAAADSWSAWLRAAGRTAAEIRCLREAGQTDAQRLGGIPVRSDGPIGVWCDQLADAMRKWELLPERKGQRARVRADRILFSHIHMLCNRLGVGVADEYRFYILLDAVSRCHG